MNGAFRKIK